MRDPFNGCKPVYPWNFIRTNTIYGVIHAAGGYTAWSDKHAVYSLVSGPTGTNLPSNVDDYYSPEVNSNQIVLPGIKTAAPAGKSFDCGTLVPNGDDWTTDFDAIKCYDQLKVNAVVNWINGKTHLGGSGAPVPVIFGMNFQAVSVGEKLISPSSTTRTDSNSGGYEDAPGTPRPFMLGEIEFVDAAIGQMVDALKANRPPRLDRHHHHRQTRAVADRPEPLLPHSGAFKNQWQATLRDHQLFDPGGVTTTPITASESPRTTFLNCG